VAGLVAKRFGAGIGGLFLAFPAILPGTATLIEKHEKEKKQKAGMDGTERGRRAAGVDAAGAAMGAVGLAAFGLVAWEKLPDSHTAIVLLGATLAWMATSILIWFARETLWRRLEQRYSSHRNHSSQQRQPVTPKAIKRRIDG
jgi:hypothetical protein